jgi:hypothetical protein
VLEVEYAQSWGTGAPAEPAIRARLARSNRRGWMFALCTDAAGNVWDAPGLERLKQRFNAAPEPPSLGVFLANLIQTAQRRHQLSALVACALRFDRVVVARVGPAYCYVLRNHFATLLTLDRVEVTDYQLRPGDVLLLCTEMLYRAVKGSEIAEIAGRAPDLGEAVSSLAARAQGPLAMIRILGVQGKSPAGTIAIRNDSRAAS